MFGDASMEIFGMAEKITIFQQSNDNDFILESTMLDLPSQALVSVFTEQTIMHLGTEWGDFESCISSQELNAYSLSKLIYRYPEVSFEINTFHLNNMISEEKAMKGFN